VWVLNAKSELESREVQTGSVVNKQWVIEQGLKPGEQVVVTNAAMQTGDTKVTPKLVNATDKITKAVAP
jgi:multidrug efflux system membrane fusion protein